MSVEISYEARKILGMALALHSRSDVQFLIDRLTLADSLLADAIIDAPIDSQTLTELRKEACNLIGRANELDDEELAIMAVWILSFERDENKLKSLHITRRLESTPHKIANITKTVTKLVERGWLELPKEAEQQPGHNWFSITNLGAAKAVEIVKRTSNVVQIRADSAS